MRLMLAVKNIHDTVEYSRKLVGKDIHNKLSPGQLRILSYLKRERLM
jgi:hypothetical protein